MHPQIETAALHTFTNAPVSLTLFIFFFILSFYQRDNSVTHSCSLKKAVKAWTLSKTQGFTEVSPITSGFLFWCNQLLQNLTRFFLRKIITDTWGVFWMDKCSLFFEFWRIKILITEQPRILYAITFSNIYVNPNATNESSYCCFFDTVNLQLLAGSTIQAGGLIWYHAMRCCFYVIVHSVISENGYLLPIVLNL